MTITPFFKVPSIKRLGLLLLVIVPIASWFLVKPVRVVAPTFAGVSCLTPTICVDDISQLPAASDLYAEANQFLSSRLSALRHEPRIVFCATQSCADSFGLGARSAVTVGTFGSVIGPRAWKAYYVRHELIHQLQTERLGVLAVLLKPAWFVEGMAYALSADPRSVLAEPWQAYRSQFNTWYNDVEKSSVWAAANRL